MSSAQLSRTSQPINKGCYVATCLSNNLQVGYDTFEVRECGDGLVVESKHVMFGGLMPVQEARFEVDADWTPRRLEMRAEDLMSAVIEFGEAETSVVARSPQGEQRMTFPMGRHRAYFFMNGSLYFPMHIVRRFDFDNPAPQLFDVTLGGVCEVKRVADLVEGDEVYRQLEMRCQIERVEDQNILVVNRRGDLVRYKTRNQNILVRLEGAE